MIYANLPSKTFAQFFHKSATGENLIPACGDRAVIILDGRESAENRNQVAADECRRRNFLAYQIMRGTFAQSSPVGPLTVI